MSVDFDKQSYLIEYQSSFVKAQQQQHEDGTPRKKSSVQHHLTGTEVKDFYESIVSDTAITTGDEQTESISGDGLESTASTVYLSDGGSTNIVKNQMDDIVSHVVKRTGRPNSDFFDYRRWVNSLLKYSAHGELNNLKELVDSVRHRSNFTDLLNSIDSYGWSALMCSGAEGHLHVVKFLIRAGCLYKDVFDSTGRDLISICEEKNRSEVLDYLKSLEQSRRHRHKKNKVKKSDKSVTCKLCGQNYSESLKTQHEASTVHIFKDKSKTASNVLGIPGNNIGYQMMLRSGWNAQSGLGPHGSGCKNPVKTVLKQDRTGLGLIKKPIKRISHFNAYDVSAIKKVKTYEVAVERKQKKFTQKTYVEKKKKERDWEMNLRHHMSTDF